MAASTANGTEFATSRALLLRRVGDLSLRERQGRQALDAAYVFVLRNARPMLEPTVWPVVFAVGTLSRLLAAAGNRGKRRR
jgi:hypothetical protein